jgi:hypothetical protein
MAKHGMWPTPKAADGTGGGQINPPKGQMHLMDAVKQRFPTPTVQDASNNGGAAQMERNTPPLNLVAGGALNPTWVEWLMGWPLGWTDCGASATDKFRQWCVSHGGRWSGCGDVTSMTGVTVTVEEEGTRNE